MTGAALVVQGDALHLPLPDGSVDLIVTSPPYWALRAYSAGPGEIGSEPTPQQFLEALWAATAEMMRVLKPSGSMFVNLGDKYAAAQGGRQSAIGELPKKLVHRDAQPRQRPDLPNPPASWGTRDATTTHVSPEQAPPKSLMLLPERYRIGCVDHLGLIARAVIVWDKPNGLPESVQDRVRRSHEDWVHLTRQPRYYSALDEVREAYSDKTNWTWSPETHIPKDATPVNGGRSRLRVKPEGSLGKLPGSVWTIPSEPLRLPEHLGVQHYAAFPSEWPRRLILGFSPPGICVECGQGRVPVVERDRQNTRPLLDAHALHGAHGQDGRSFSRGETAATILGYACSCTPYTDHPGTGPDGRPDQLGGALTADGYVRPGPETTAGRQAWQGGPTSLAYKPRIGPWREYHLDGWKPPPTRPAIILDPFSGVGTTIGVAKRLGRIGVGVDLSGPYCRAAKWRVNDPDQFGKAEGRSWLGRQGSLL